MYSIYIHKSMNILLPKQNVSVFGISYAEKAVHKKNIVCCTPTYPRLNPLPKTFFGTSGKYFLPHFHQEIMVFPLCSNDRKKHMQTLFFPYLPTVPTKPEDHWSCIAHLSAEDMLKSAVIEEKKFKHSPRVGTDNPLGPKF